MPCERIEIPPTLDAPGGVMFVCRSGRRGRRKREKRATDARLTVVPDAPRSGVWLVLSLCPDCIPRLSHYCSAHGPNNWWLTRWGQKR